MAQTGARDAAERNEKVFKMMKMNQFALIGVLISACAGDDSPSSDLEAAAPQNANAGATPTCPSANRPVVSWSEYNSTTNDLVSNSDVAALLTILSIDVTKCPTVRVSAKVDEWIWAKNGSAPTESTISFNWLVAAGTGPDILVGDQSVFFLKNYQADLFTVSGGPSGRFLVDDGKVVPAVSNAVPIPAGTGVDQLATLLGAR